MQQADAQAGRVLKDKNGHWVRVQQYILRPDNQTVQLLNVCLRGVGDHAGLSTMDFTTRFTESYTGDLRDLPWNDWLRTEGPYLTMPENDYRYVEYDGPPDLESMYVKFTSPSGRYLKESRSFGSHPQMQQEITSETLELSLGGSNDGTYTYTDDWRKWPVTGNKYWVYPDTSFMYSPQGKNPAPFYYMYRYGLYNDDPSKDQIAPLVMMDFFVVGDGDTDQNQGVSIDDYSGQSFRDIWDTLRVNEPGAPQIGNNNLEMAFKRGWSSTATIDVVYIPMSRMLWKDLP
jgi:hypothetical protein